ncbi:universal stress protein [Verrucomicrobiota bacterium]
MKIEIKKILCPVDFSENAAYATRYALALAEEYNAELILLQVTHVPAVTASDYYSDYPGCELETTNTCIRELQKSNNEQLEKLTADLRERHNCQISTRHETGKPFFEIISTAKKENVNLIVMGTHGHGRTSLRYILIGSTAEKVVRMAPCPVLTVKHPEHEFIVP